MNKFLFKLSLLTMAPILFFASQASALNYETAYMTRANNNHVLSLDADGHYSYNAGEKPWVYIKFKYENLALGSPLHMHWVWSSLTDPNNTETHDEKISLTGLSGDKELWRSAPEPWWTTNGGAGQWHVDVNWFNVHGTNGISSADFTVCSGGIVSRTGPCGPVVTPEPLSTTLFLLGGAPLIAAIRKRQKTI